MNAENEKLHNLATTLGDVENKLLHRALDRSRADAEHAYDFVNRAIEAGVAELDCDGCDDDQVDGEDAPSVDDGSVDSDGEDAEE